LPTLPKYTVFPAPFQILHADLFSVAFIFRETFRYPSIRPAATILDANVSAFLLPVVSLSPNQKWIPVPQKQGGDTFRIFQAEAGQKT
jgi:hypothetical protein